MNRSRKLVGILTVIIGGTLLVLSPTRVASAGDHLHLHICPDGQVLKFLEGGWVCSDDNDTNTDTLADLDCAIDEIAKFNGSGWECNALSSAQGDLTPPTISHNASSYSGGSQFDLEFSITDDTELGYIAYRDFHDPTNDLFTLLEPEVTTTVLQFQISLQGGTNTFVGYATDTSGNMTKSLAEIEYYCTDCDGDGYRSPQYGGNDCNDEDDKVYPGQMAFYRDPYVDLETGGESFDYNCDGIEEKKYTDIVESFELVDGWYDCGYQSGVMPHCRSTTTGWWPEVAECGQTADYFRPNSNSSIAFTKDGGCDPPGPGCDYAFNWQYCR